MSNGKLAQLNAGDLELVSNSTVSHPMPSAKIHAPPSTCSEICHSVVGTHLKVSRAKGIASQLSPVSSVTRPKSVASLCAASPSGRPTKPARITDVGSVKILRDEGAPGMRSNRKSCNPMTPMTLAKVGCVNKCYHPVSCPQLDHSVARDRLRKRFGKEVPGSLLRPQSAVCLRETSHAGHPTERSRPFSAQTYTSRQHRAGTKFDFPRVPQECLNDYSSPFIESSASLHDPVRVNPMDRLSQSQALARKLQSYENRLESNSLKQQRILCGLDAQVTEAMQFHVYPSESSNSASLTILVGSDQTNDDRMCSNTDDLGKPTALEAVLEPISRRLTSSRTPKFFRKSISLFTPANILRRSSRKRSVEFNKKSDHGDNSPKGSVARSSLSSLGEGFTSFFSEASTWNNKSYRRSSVFCDQEVANKAAEAFTELKDENGEISCDSVVLALQQLGYSHPVPNKDEVQVICNELCIGRSFMSREEYFKVIPMYHKRYWAKLRQMFQEANSDGSGSLSREDIAAFLKKHNITPMGNLLEELIQEVSLNVDGRAPHIGLNGFLKLRQIIDDRRGFSMSEAGDIKATFQEFASEDKQRVEASLLCEMLQKQGLIIDHSLVKELATQVRCEDQQLAEGLNDREFVFLVRKCHERELMEISSAMAAVSRDQNPCIGSESLPDFFRYLGIIVSPPVLLELQEACSIFSGKKLVLDDVYRLVQAFRESQGFLSRERAEMHQAFLKFEKDLTHVDGISGSEVVRAMQWLGYPATERTVKDAILERHISHDFKSKDFLNVLGRFREEQLAALRTAFGVRNKSGKLPVGEMKQLLTSLGYDTSCEFWDQFLEEIREEIGAEDTELDMWEMDDAIGRFRRAVRDRFQAHEGFSDSATKSFKELFDSHDKHRTGMISHAPLRAILNSYLPKIEKGGKDSQEEYNFAKAILHESDKDGNQQIDFEEFLHMMRLIENHNEEKKVVNRRLEFTKERAAIRFSSFNFQEVLEFRKIYLANAKESCGGIDPSDFEDMLVKLVQTKSMGSELRQLHFSELTKMLMHSISHDLNGSLDFPDFLCVMRRFMDLASERNEVKARSGSEEKARNSSEGDWLERI